MIGCTMTLGTQIMIPDVPTDAGFIDSAVLYEYHDIRYVNL